MFRARLSVLLCTLLMISLLKMTPKNSAQMLSGAVSETPQAAKTARDAKEESDTVGQYLSTTRSQRTERTGESRDGARGGPGGG